MWQVTPAFQKFVASKLDELLELQDVEVGEESSGDAHVQKISGVKLTKRSRIHVNPEETEAALRVQRKPSLLAHREPQVRREIKTNKQKSTGDCRGSCRVCCDWR